MAAAAGAPPPLCMAAPAAAELGATPSQGGMAASAAAGGQGTGPTLPELVALGAEAVVVEARRTEAPVALGAVAARVEVGPH